MYAYHIFLHQFPRHQCPSKDISSLCLGIYSLNRQEFSLVTCLQLVAYLVVLYIAKTFPLVTQNSCSFHSVYVSICSSGTFSYIQPGVSPTPWTSTSILSNYLHGLWSLSSNLFFLEIYTQSQKRTLYLAVRSNRVELCLRLPLKAPPNHHCPPKEMWDSQPRVPQSVPFFVVRVFTDVIKLK